MTFNKLILRVMHLLLMSLYLLVIHELFLGSLLR